MSYSSLWRKVQTLGHSCVLLILLAAHGEATPPPPSGRPYSLAEIASSLVEYADIIIDGAIEEVVPSPIPLADNKCQWQSRIRVKVLRPIVGEIVGDTIEAWTNAFPSGFVPNGPSDCSILTMGGQVELPARGARGIFSLTQRTERRRNAQLQILYFTSLPGQWLSSVDGQVNAHAFGGHQQVSYDALVSELELADREQGLESLASRSSFIALVKLGEYEERVVSERAGTALFIQFPVLVERLYRGAIGSNAATILVRLANDPDTADSIEARYQRHVTGLFYPLQSKNALVFGSVTGTDIKLTRWGLVEVTSDSGGSWFANLGTTVVDGNVSTQRFYMDQLEGILR